MANEDYENLTPIEEQLAKYLYEKHYSESYDNYRTWEEQKAYKWIWDKYPNIIQDPVEYGLAIDEAREILNMLNKVN